LIKLNKGKDDMKSLLVLIVAIAVFVTGVDSFAQSTDARTEAKAEAKAAATAKKKREYAAKQKAMEDASRSSASGSMAEASKDKSVPKSRPSGANAMQSQMELQQATPSKPVDKSAKTAPRPNASNMTQAERDAYRKDVAKDAKP
jgi:hypothetical protein